MRYSPSIISCFIFLLVFSHHAYAKDTSKQQVSHNLFMADGQLTSHPVRLFVKDQSITKSMNPELCLIRLQGESNNDEKTEYEYCLDQKIYKPIEIAVDQNYKGILPMTGTIMLFDLSSLHIPILWTGKRVLPVLLWSTPGSAKGQAKALSSSEVYLSHRLGTTIWTLASLISLIFFIRFVTKDEDNTSPWKLLSTNDGFLSISLVQMALWTLVASLGSGHANYLK